MTPRVVKHAPPTYESQQGFTCGEINARTAIAAFGIQYRPPEDRRWRIRAFGFSFLSDIAGLLADHGLSAPIGQAKGQSDVKRLESIKHHLDRDEPVIVAIGNGHLSRARYVPGLRYLVGYFLTGYGYDSDREVFFVYDSYLTGDHHEQIPIENEVRTFAEFLRDWSGPFYQAAIGMKHSYMPISLK